VLKLTKPGFHGAQGTDAGAYLQRWELHNAAFNDNARLEGMVDGWFGIDIWQGTINVIFTSGLA
jgi:hypothetical protein